MSQPSPIQRPDVLEAANSDLLPPEKQAAADAEHASTGWSAYDVWHERVFVPQQPGYNKPRGNT
jgi:hypothetical protein